MTEQQCSPKYEDVCSTVYDEQCSTVYEEVCEEAQPQYNTGYGVPFTAYGAPKQCTQVCMVLLSSRSGRYYLSTIFIVI